MLSRRIESRQCHMHVPASFLPHTVVPSNFQMEIVERVVKPNLFIFLIFENVDAQLVDHVFVRSE